MSTIYAHCCYIEYAILVKKTRLYGELIILNEYQQWQLNYSFKIENEI